MADVEKKAWRWAGHGDQAILVDGSDRYPEAPYTIRAVEPVGWRDAWAVLLGRYVPRLRVSRPANLKMFDDDLREHYVGPVRDQLNADSPFFNQHQPEGRDNGREDRG